MAKSRVLFASFFGRSPFVWLAIGLVGGLLLAGVLSQTTGAQVSNGANIVVTPSEANFDSATEVWIYGSNIAPGTQVAILLKDGNGVYTDLSAASTPFPVVVNEDGAFAAKWVLDRWTRPGVGAEGLFTVRVFDENFNEIGSAPLALCQHEREEGAEVPEHCSQ